MSARLTSTTSSHQRQMMDKCTRVLCHIAPPLRSSVPPDNHFLGISTFTCPLSTINWGALLVFANHGFCGKRLRCPVSWWRRGAPIPLWRRWTPASRRSPGGEHGWTRRGRRRGYQWWGSWGCSFVLTAISAYEEGWQVGRLVLYQHLQPGVQVKFPAALRLAISATWKLWVGRWFASPIH